MSARDIQLPQTQFYEAKSYPTFTPTGPELVLLDGDELKRFGDLRLRLSVNGSQRQNAVVEGSPVGTALSAPPKPIEIIGNLLPPAVKWKTFFKRQAANPKYLRDGDVVEAMIGTDDGAIDLGAQRMTVRYR